MSDVARTLLKLAYRAAERGDTEGARLGLLAVLAMPVTSADEAAPAPELRAVRKKKLAALLDVSLRHIDKLERTLPPEAVLGSGSGKRYVVAIVFAALSRAPSAAVADEVADEGRAHARRKARLKLVPSDG